MNAPQIRKVFQLNSPKSKHSQTNWTLVFHADVMDSHYRMGGVTFQVRQTAYGIMWAFRTGRLTTETDMALRAMNAHKFAQLLAEVAQNCATINDIPAFLNK